MSHESLLNRLRRLERLLERFVAASLAAAALAAVPASADTGAALAAQPATPLARPLARPFKRTAVPQTAPPIDLAAMLDQRDAQKLAIPILVAFARELAGTRKRAEARERERERQEALERGGTGAGQPGASRPQADAEAGTPEAGHSEANSAEEQPNFEAYTERGMVKVIDRRTGALADSGAAMIFLNRKKR